MESLKNTSKILTEYTSQESIRSARKVKRATLEQWMVLVVLVVATVGLRLLLSDIPNFAPVAAVALFAGYYFRNGWLAVLAPLSVMWVK